MQLTKKDLNKGVKHLPADQVCIKHFPASTQKAICLNGGCTYQDGSTRVHIRA